MEPTIKEVAHAYDEAVFRLKIEAANEWADIYENNC